MSERSRHLQAMLRSSFPPTQSTPDIFRIQTVFRRQEQEATARGLGRSSWMALATATMIAVGSEASMVALYDHATASMSLGESVAIAEFMRDVGIRGIAVIGIPRIVNMLVAFHAALPLAVRSSLSTTPLCCVNADSVESINKQGEKLWDSIHAPGGSAMERKLAKAHPDLANFIKYQVYGGLLARHRGQTVRRIGTSLSAIACLRAVWGTNSQLLGHILGLKKVWRDGYWRTEPSAGSEGAIEWLASDEGCTWVLEAVDELVLAVTGGCAAGHTMVAAKL